MSDSNLHDITLCTELFSGSSLHAHRHPQRLALRRSYLWPNGTKLRVRFIKVRDEASDSLKERVKKYALEWTTYANIRFYFVTEAPADIRVSFTQNNASWSEVGTSSKAITSQDKPTMNLPLDNGISDDDCRRHTLHEFGHAIGCIHEHQSPAADIPWDKDAVYRWYKYNMSWSKDKVDKNILNRDGADITDYSAFDAKSIMLYPIPSSLTTNGYSTDMNYELSDTDKSFIAKAYPMTDEIGFYKTKNDITTVVDGQTNSGTVDFNNTLENPPQVAVGLRSIDISNDAGGGVIRVKAYADSISQDDFTMHIDSWADTRLYNASASWLEVASDNIHFQFGVCEIESDPGDFIPHDETQSINFEKPFSSQPKVFACISGIDLGVEWCLAIVTSNIDPTGFSLQFLTTENAELHGARVDWIAFPDDKPGIIMGEFGGNNFSGHVDFGTAFMKPPKVFVALRDFELDSSQSFRVKLSIKSVKTTGMDWYIDTWGNSVLESVRGTYLALDL